MFIKFKSHTAINDIFNKMSLYGNGNSSSVANKQIINNPEITI